MAIKNAREMALLPYENRVTTQRGGRGGDVGNVMMIVTREPRETDAPKQPQRRHLKLKKLTRKYH